MKPRRPRQSRRWWKWILGIALTPIMTLALAGGLILWHPEIAWGLVQRYVLPADLKVSWGEMHFKPRRLSWRNWEIDWAIKDLSVQKGDPLVVAPIDEVTLQFQIFIFTPRLGVDFDRVIVKSAKTLRYQPSVDPEPSPPQSPYQRAQTYLHLLDLGNHYARMNTFELDLAHIELILADPISLAVAATKATDKPVEFNVTAKAKTFEASLKGALDPAQLESAKPALTAHATFKGFDANAETDLAVVVQNEVIHVEGQGPLEYARERALYRTRPNVRADLSGDHLNIEVKSVVTGLPAPLEKLEQVTAKVNAPLVNDATWSTDPGQFSVAGPVDLFFISSRVRAALETACACKIPAKLAVNLGGRFWAPNLTGTPQYKVPAAEVRLSIESVKNKLFTTALAANVNVYRQGTAWDLQPRLDSEVHILSYRGVRRLLDGLNVLIPAPFDVLEGTVDLVAKSPLAREPERTKIPLQIATNLASEHQKVNVTAAITAELDSAFKNIDVFVKILFQAFEVQLPPLDPIAGMPKVIKDARIQLEPPKVAAATPVVTNKGPVKVRLYLEAKTATPAAIKLLSSFAKPEVPISIDISRGLDQSLTGWVQLEPFSLQYLRRVVHVESMRLLMDAKDQGDFPVDGRLRVDQTQYKIFIDIGGTLRKPLIRFSSEPYLDKKDIIAVLLFDRVPSEASDVETSGSFESAVADRAIGLFGIWAFASTPIRNFSYNPVTHVYAATVQLADGLTAGIGTDWEEAAHLEVRKRVSKRWVLTASVSPSDADHSQVGKLVLQWEKRF